MANAQVTQQVAEVVVAGDASAKVTQQVAEVVLAGAAFARISQQVAEVVITAPKTTDVVRAQCVVAS